MVKNKVQASERNTPKESRGFLFTVIAVVLVGNIVYYISVYGFRLNMSFISTFAQDLSSFKLRAIAFLMLWGILLGLLVIALVPTKKEPAAKVRKVEIEKTPAIRKAFTDIDVLYATLQKKGSLSMSAISDIFKINKEKAMEWSKILDSHGLATIHYKVFAEPLLVVKEEE